MTTLQQELADYEKELSSFYWDYILTDSHNIYQKYAGQHKLLISKSQRGPEFLALYQKYQRN